MSIGNSHRLTLVLLLVVLSQLKTIISFLICSSSEQSSICSCIIKNYERQIECRVNDSRITITTVGSDKAWINCHHTDLEVFSLDSLPKINFRFVFIKHVTNCPLQQTQFEKSVLFQMFCLSSTNELTIESSGPISRAHFKLQRNLKLLTLVGSELQKLPEDIFDDLTKLASLTLENYKLELSLNLFAALHKLFTLNLGENNLHNLPPGIFRHQRQLHRLSLDHNYISHLTKESFEGCFSVRFLSLYSNKIVTFPSDAFALLTSLQHIELGGNYIHSLPEGLFAANRALTDLNLNDNQVTELSAGVFANQLHLNYLTIRHNRLMALPDGLFSKSNQLQTLDLSHNHLANISNATFFGLSSLSLLRLNNNNLREIHAEAFVHTQQLTHLELQNNQLQFVQLTSFFDLGQLKKLDLANNSIETVHISSSLNITVRKPMNGSIFDLSRNKIQRLEDTVLSAFSPSRSLSLAGNPWKCDCAAEGLINFMRLEHKLILDIDQVKCVDGRKVLHLSVSDICFTAQGLIIAGCVLIAMVGLCATFWFKYQQEVKVWLYARGMCLQFISEEDLDKDKLYDAFVSYSHRDEHFVTDCLLPELESGPTPFKICIHIRDWVIGEFIPNQIVQSVADSRRTIIVLSENFIESVWARLEFRAAHTAALTEGRARVIVIIYGDVGIIDSLDSETKEYLKMHTYIKWGDPWFWKKLRYAMPHSARNRDPNGHKVELIES